MSLTAFNRQRRIAAMQAENIKAEAEKAKAAEVKPEEVVTETEATEEVKKPSRRNSK